MTFREISAEEMVTDLKNLAAAPLALGEDDDFRISIAGAQEKTAYLRIADHWAKPSGITPTSRIIKTPMGIWQIVELLRESDDPIRDRETFFRAQIFYFLIGATDGHAKNFSLRLGRRGRFRLAPLYDILSLAPVFQAGRLERQRYRLAMSIDGHYGIDEIAPRHFEAEGKASGLPKTRALELLAEMADRPGPTLERTNYGLANKVPGSVSDPIKTDSA
jgi:serine/threonine protein kinase HipA of HipAB toxin-antitoxin module